MTPEIKTAVSLIVQIFFVLFMLGSGTWVALDAKRHGRPPSEYILWGLFTCFFVFLGLLVYLLWRKHFYNQE